MEIIIGLVAIVVVGLLWHTNTKKKIEETVETTETPKPTLNAADLAAKEFDQRLWEKSLANMEPNPAPVITPSLNPMQSLPVTVAEPAPVVEAKPAKKARVGKKAATAAKAADKATKATKAKPAAKKTPARKSGGKKVG